MWQVRVHDEDRVHDGDDGWLTYQWETESEAQAFYEGTAWVNDSALTIEKPEPIPEPEQPPVLAHCDTCGEEVWEDRAGFRCGRDMTEEKGPDAGFCPGTYVEGPLPIFTLTRIEEIDVTYDIKAPTLDAAFDAMRSWDENLFVRREEDSAAYFNSSEERYLGTDDDWHYQGDGVEPKIEEAS